MPISPHHAGSATGDALTLREQEALARYSKFALLRYRDLDAGYCQACGEVFGVRCPKCKADAGKHGHRNDIFKVETPGEYRREENRVWTVVRCAKCDYRFKVLVR